MSMCKQKILYGVDRWGLGASHSIESRGFHPGLYSVAALRLQECLHPYSKPTPRLRRKVDSRK